MPLGYKNVALDSTSKHVGYRIKILKLKNKKLSFIEYSSDLIRLCDKQLTYLISASHNNPGSVYYYFSHFTDENTKV